ncbi:MAG: UDP-3-O-(3-hydroxymyristoyl)glucosamine N-acyltransferase [Flavobacteriales bacterium]|nr:UDP-3-O-(3-hydroxymyristoyl)glucosamine N-acyltransferase [Flavobacteriales bacterium]
MKFKADQVAEMLNGTVDGNPDVYVSTLSKIEEGIEGSISFLSNDLYTPYIYDTDASLVVVNESFVPEKDIKATLIRVKDARESFAALLAYFDPNQKDIRGIHPSSVIAEGVEIDESNFVGACCVIESGAKIGKNVKLYAQVFIGENAVIGDNTIVLAGAKILYRCELGADIIIHPGVVIGGDGFGFAPNSENNYAKVPQIGNVIIEDHVEIGSNTTIDRATLGSTIIRKGVKLDNLIQIAHNVEIGENTVMAAQVGIAGSTKLGKNCMMGGQSGLIGHITLADGVMIAGQSGVGKSVEKEGEVLIGSPAIPKTDYGRTLVIAKRVPKLIEEVKLLKAEIENLKNLITENGR